MHELCVSGLTDVGRHRAHNEDSLLVADDLNLYLVCDGMGGAQAGEVASRRCVEVIYRVIRDNSEVLQTYTDRADVQARQQVVRLVEHAISAANAEIYQLAASAADKHGMGTTAVLLLICGANAIMAHVGDSRIYLLRQERIHQLTEDHSLIAEQLRRGLISAEEAEKSTLSNVIMRAVGTREYVEVDTLHLELMPGDRFVLCSDGLSGPVCAPEIGSVVASADPEAAARKLVDLANERGGPDNVTALVIQICGDVVSEVTIAAKLQVLHQQPLFAHFSFKELMLTLEVVSERSYAAGDVIIEEGSVGDEFFVLLDGQAQVSKGEKPLTLLQGGAHFGEMCLLDEAPRSATISALSPVRALLLRRADLYPLMQREPELAVKLLWAFCHQLMGRLRETSAELSGAKEKMQKLESLPTPFATRHGISAVAMREDNGGLRGEVTVPYGRPSFAGDESND